MIALVACLWSFGFVATWSWGAEEENDAQLEMVAGLVGDADREMRAIGLQFVRGELPGEAATKRFLQLLPDLATDAQADLLEALGERGDAAARPKVLEMVDGKEEVVRIASLRALGGLGGAADVPLLAKLAAAGSDDEKSAALQSLVRLRGEDVNAAVVAGMSDAETPVQVALLGVLADRNAKEALPSVLEAAKGSEPAVRVAALNALRYLADEGSAAAIVDLLKSATEDAEKGQAETTLLVVCSRGREKCAGAIIAGLDDADASARVPLLRALARAGGAESLAAIVEQLNSDDEALRDEAVRMLSVWPDPAVKSHLMELAGKDDNLRHHILAIRGLVRLASPQQDRPADVETLSKVMDMAKRPQEKQLVIGALGGIGTFEALDIAASVVGDAAFTEEAGLAAVQVAEKIEDGDADEIRAAMQKVQRFVQNPQTHERVQKVLESL
jgi:HEAT repeat protein